MKKTLDNYRSSLFSGLWEVRGPVSFGCVSVEVEDSKLAKTLSNTLWIINTILVVL